MQFIGQRLQPAAGWCMLAVARRVQQLAVYACLAERITGVNSGLRVAADELYATRYIEHGGF